ncbi:histidine triad (HIT) family protein [Alkalithermobacter thermoalcaliphilus JW-YL-7 = DSM 7308]|uniref:Histidine triad (HIT) family protein n=1 Tax=Alkalithermobacter thermoalcaliphilus JW-YL-7 = DSM 7308 TaxID=1121328 RepID=A0A150FR56_CLOPD|nr:histidine triad (HIT) protein [[Clostridium] paradoxum JW-YL-7 = DSM 7308]SHL01027.1 histidine triad (HIT) family protein [[Clostridium] paradoxum JW-YL-7 = DSM 7308]
MENCIFCKIVKGELPAQKVYESEKVLAFKDINPKAPVHILVIPKKHYDSIIDINDDEMDIISHIHVAINKIAKDMGVDKTGFRIVNNCGEDACQEVKHVHYHILGGKKLRA